MIDRETKTVVEDALDPLVERAVTLLRRPELVREAWRDELVAQISGGGSRRAKRGLLRVWIPLGIAAAFLAVVGFRQLAARGAGDRIRFSVSAPSARQVSLVGDFNGWNPGAVPMRRGPSDTWIVDVRLRPGRHVFAFSIDGALRADSAAPRAVEDDFGVPGSVIVVSERGTE